MTLEELEAIVKQLQTEVNTLKDSVATLTNQVSKEFLQKLQDVQINDQLSPLTFGDVLQYGNDGKWHNVQPSVLGITGGGSSGSATKLTELSDVRITGVLSDGQVLTYSAVNQVWLNKDQIKINVDLSSYLTKNEAKLIYFPIAGGTIEGAVTINDTLHVLGNITSEQAITAKAIA